MSSSPTVAAENLVVSFQYRLQVNGKTVDSSQQNGPLAVLLGANNIVPGLERALIGRELGEEFTVLVPPEDGYGTKQGPGPQALPRDAFPPEAELHQGMSFVAESESGELHRLWVVEVQKEIVRIDRNHPLAGETLQFDVSIESIRAATPEEIQHGHVHGPGGHHH